MPAPWDYEKIGPAAFYLSSIGAAAILTVVMVLICFKIFGS